MNPLYLADTSDGASAPATWRGGLREVTNQIGQVVLGKSSVIELALTCVIARGHLLIEDLPGVGKTTLAHAIARALGLDFQRIQFTSDLLPADLLGASVYRRDSESFEFHPGPIFSQVVVADEINRASPKAQSALLEAMEEQQVTHDGKTYPLPEPFFVVATENPMESAGTFALPDSQLDRFLMRVALGYPDTVAERALLEGQDRRTLLHRLRPAMAPADLAIIQEAARAIHLSSALIDYVQALVQFSRETPELRRGLSPRAALALVHAAQAMALVREREHVVPEDVQRVLPAVVDHRLMPSGPGSSGKTQLVPSDVLLEQVPVS